MSSSCATLSPTSIRECVHAFRSVGRASPSRPRAHTTTIGVTPTVICRLVCSGSLSMPVPAPSILPPVSSSIPMRTTPNHPRSNYSESITRLSRSGTNPPLSLGSRPSSSPREFRCSTPSSTAGRCGQPVYCASLQASHLHCRPLDVCGGHNAIPTSPNHALQRTAPCVTTPASTATFPPAMQVPRRTPRSLSLGSLGVIEWKSMTMKSFFLSTIVVVLSLADCRSKGNAGFQNQSRERPPNAVPSPGKQADDRLNYSLSILCNRYNGEADWDKIDPITFVETLEACNHTFVTIWNHPPRGWMKPHHYEALKQLEQSGRPCASFVDAKSSFVPTEKVTVGQAVTAILEQFGQGESPATVHSPKTKSKNDHQ